MSPVKAEMDVLLGYWWVVMGRRDEYKYQGWTCIATPRCDCFLHLILPFGTVVKMKWDSYMDAASKADPWYHEEE